MELRARIRPFPRHAAFLAASVALFASAAAGAVAPDAHAAKKKKAPVITSVAPKDVAVGEILTIRGRNFRVGRSRNTVVFKRDGARAVFVKASVGTRKMLRLEVPDSVQEFFALNAGNPVPTRFRLRVLAAKFGRKFTSNKLSPIVSGPRPPAAKTPTDSLPDGDCDGDGAKNKHDDDDDNDGLADAVELSLSLDPCLADTDADGLLDKWEFDCDRDGALNRDEDDDDDDLIADARETQIGTNPCSGDSDGDAVLDGYEYQSAIDLNDDHYQSPDTILFYPGKLPYANPLFKDNTLDFDGDGLTLEDEYALWSYTVARWAPRALDQLTYSDGEKYTRSITAASYRSAPADGSEAELSKHKQWQFLTTAASQGYGETVLLNMDGATVAGSVAGLPTWDGDGVVSALERNYFDEDHNGQLRDDELDEDGDGIGNYDEAHGYMKPTWWAGIYAKEGPYAIPYAGTRLDDADTDGDSIVDGADDQDHDGFANVRELSRRLAAGELKDGTLWAAPGDSRDWIRPLQAGTDAAISQPFRAMVNPFNPCLPDTESPTCPERAPAGGGWAPFNLNASDIFKVYN